MAETPSRSVSFVKVVGGDLKEISNKDVMCEVGILDNPEYSTCENWIHLR